MATTETNVAATHNAVIDLEPLLAPLPGENPSGESLQYTGLYDEIREARRADEELAQGDWVTTLKTADWHQVLSLATDALSTRTRDLQVCAWLSEALVKLYGFPGLRDGLWLTHEMMVRYWDTIYPEIDEGDLEARANVISWLDRQLAYVLRDVPVSQSVTGLRYTFNQSEDSKRFDVPDNIDDLEFDERRRIEELKKQAEEEGRITSEQWRLARNTTKRAFYEDTYSILNQCWEEYKALDQATDEKFERQTPGLGALKKSLDEVRTFIEKIVREKRQEEPDDAPAAEEIVNEDGTVTVAAHPGQTRQGPAGPIKDRQEALRRLGEVADYFRRTEPHSPVSYLVQRAIKWGQMPLDAWLEDVIKNDGVLDNLRETLGLKNGGKEE